MGRQSTNSRTDSGGGGVTATERDSKAGETKETMDMDINRDGDGSRSVNGVFPAKIDLVIKLPALVVGAKKKER